METEIETTKAHVHATGTPAQERSIHATAAQVGRFLLHYLEMVVAMMVGMPFLFILRNRVLAPAGYAATFVRGTNLFDLSMLVVMTVPMVAWMVVRGHGWRHSAEMAAGMSAPMLLVVALRLLGISQPWLTEVGYQGMFLGMLAVMIYRRDHYTGKGHGSAQDHSNEAAQAECH